MNFIDAGTLGKNGAKTIGIRPEHISIGMGDGDLEGRVSHVEHLGADTNLFVDCDDAGLLAVRLSGEQDFEFGTSVLLEFAKDRVYRFDDANQTIV